MSRLFSYIPRQSPVHALDPRVKFLWAALCSGLAWYLRHPVPLLGLLACLALYWIAGKVAAQGYRFVLAISPLLIASFVMWNLVGQQGGQVWFSIGFLKLTDANLALAVAAATRILIMSGSFYSLLATTDFGSMIAGLCRIRVPYVIAFSVGLTLQLIPIIIQEFSSIQDAQRSRGQELDRGGLFERIRNYLSIAVPLLLRSLRLGQTLSFALITYRFGGNQVRTSVHRLRLGFADYSFIALCMIVTTGLVIWQEVLRG